MRRRHGSCGTRSCLLLQGLQPLGTKRCAGKAELPFVRLAHVKEGRTSALCWHSTSLPRTQLCAEQEDHNSRMQTAALCQTQECARELAENAWKTPEWHQALTIQASLATKAHVASAITASSAFAVASTQSKSRDNDLRVSFDIEPNQSIVDYC